VKLWARAGCRHYLRLTRTLEGGGRYRLHFRDQGRIINGIGAWVQAEGQGKGGERLEKGGIVEILGEEGSCKGR